MKSLIFLVPILCLVISPTTTIASWPKPSEVSNEDMLMNTEHNHYFGNKLNFKDSKVWKCTYNNGSGAAVSISYPSPPHPPSPKPPTPSSRPPSPLSPKKSPPSPKPSPPPRTPKKSPPPPKPSSPPPTPKKSPPPPKPSQPPPKPSPPRRKPSPPTPKPSTTPPSPKPSPPRPTPKKSPPPPTTPSPSYQDPWVHFANCISEFGPSAICKQQMEVSYYRRGFLVSDYCCNLIVNMRHECTDVILGFFTDPFFVPLIRYTCHVKY